MTAPLPADYEPCATCGYDHEYEPAEATAEHNRLLAAYFDELLSRPLRLDTDGGLHPEDQRIIEATIESLHGIKVRAWFDLADRVLHVDPVHDCVMWAVT